MAFEHPDINQSRLLAASVEDRLMAYLARAVGAIVILLVALAWIALLSWSMTDPSLSRTTPGPIRNLLGLPGASISDLMIQTLGFAAVFALLAPSAWALELLGSGRVPEFRIKAGLLPVSILALAGGFAALPVPSTWPLHHGLGGILGDAMLTIFTSILTLVAADWAAFLAGVSFIALGSAALTHSLGLSIRGMADMVAVPRRSAEAVSAASGSTPVPNWSRDWKRAFATPAAELAGGVPPCDGIDIPPRNVSMTQPFDGANAERDVAPSPARHAGEPPAFLYAATSRAADEPTRPAPHTMQSELSAQFSPRHGGNHAPLDGRGAAFDGSTEDESRAIAERFAPASASAQPAASFSEAVSGKATGLLGVFSGKRALVGFRRPSLNLLKRPSPAKLAPEFTQTVLRGNARLLEDVLADFGIKGEVRDIKPGPIVTLFELEPARGTKASRVIALADDIARSMSATSARVAAVPGRNAIGIELPNVRRETVLLRELLESEAYKAGQMTLPLALGKSISGEPVLADLARMPHMLVAGTTGSGKSVGINTMILSLIYRLGPDECRLLMIDPKMLELSIYNGIPHLLTPVVTDPSEAVAALEWTVREMEERYKKMSQLGVRSIDIFNNRVRNARKRGEMLARTVQTGFDSATGKPLFEREELPFEPLPYIVVVVDEFADLMMVAGKEIEAAVQRLAQMARAAGIHLIMATQRPSVDIVTGTIKANFPTRIAFRVASKIDSRTILDENGAEQLLGQGDMLFASSGGQPVRVHGSFVADEEVEAVAAALREQGEPSYVSGITERLTARSTGASEDVSAGDDVYDRAVAIVLRDRKASTSYIQRRLGIGYNRAADLIERMERDRIIGPADHAGRRDILLGEPASRPAA